MREKIKGKIKKTIPIMMCFMLIFGSCVCVNAKTVSGVPLLEGNIYTFGYDYIDNSLIGVKDYQNNAYSCQVKISNCLDDIYAVLAKYEVNGIYGAKIYFISLQPFSLNIVNATSSGDSINGATSYEGHTYGSFISSSSTSRSYNGMTFYTCESGVNTTQDLTVTKSNIPLRDCGAAESYNQFLSYFVENDFIWDDGKESVYSSSPSATIESPKNLSIYRGYSSADSQYKFQMQWDKPNDSNLNVEVMYTVHWKDGILGSGSHIYKKYPYITYDSGISAQNNKLTYLEDDFLKNYFELQGMDLPSVYNITEIYVRFAKEIDGVVNYSLWRKIDYTNLDEGNGFDAGEDDYVADSVTGAFDTNDNWIDQSVSNGEIVNGSDKENAKSPGLDADGNNVTPSTSAIPDINSAGDFMEYFQEMMASLFETIGSLPKYIAEFFSFLPVQIITCLSLGLLIAIILRILGR